MNNVQNEEDVEDILSEGHKKEDLTVMNVIKDVYSPHSCPELMKSDDRV